MRISDWSSDVCSSDLLERLEKIAGRIFRPVEHQMLEQMRETGLARGFVLRPDAVPDRHRDDGRLVILMDDHAQPVVEREGLIGNVDRRPEEIGRGTMRERVCQYV